MMMNKKKSKKKQIQLSLNLRTAMLNLQNEIESIKSWEGISCSGRVTHIIGLLIESIGPSAHLGELCYIYNKQGEAIPCEVVGFKEEKVLLMSLGDMTHIAPGSEVASTGEVPLVAVSDSLCGRVIDALGKPIDGKGPIRTQQYYPTTASPPNAMQRDRIESVLETGIKALDATCTTGRGQRFGIFAGSGVGKSTLLAMIAKMAKADINVIALIGERGREVREFIEKELGPEGLARSVIVVATSDQEALLRTKGANTATAIAEYFRDQGKNVILMMDSVTRFCMAQREIGLAVGEPPTTKGYTPSVFATLPKLLERSGNSNKGSITGIYTILVEGDDLNDPIADACRSILDGHVVLSREIAASNHYPAIDVLNSLSRIMNDIVPEEHKEMNGQLRDILQVYREAEDLINIGAYSKGSSEKIDNAIKRIHSLREFLKQKQNESFSMSDAIEQLKTLLK
jgi:flagellum-specific ATP synthase